MSIKLSPDMHLHKADTWNELVRMTNQRINAIYTLQGDVPPTALPYVSVGDKVRATDIADLTSLLHTALVPRVVLKSWLTDGLSDFPEPSPSRFYTDVFGVYKAVGGWPGREYRGDYPNSLEGVTSEYYASEGYTYGSADYWSLGEKRGIIGPWIYYDIVSVLQAPFLIKPSLFTVPWPNAPNTTASYTWYGSAPWYESEVTHPTVVSGITLSSRHVAIAASYEGGPFYADTFGYLDASYALETGLEGMAKTAYLVLKARKRTMSQPGEVYQDIAELGIPENTIKIVSSNSSTSGAIPYSNPFKPEKDKVYAVAAGLPAESGQIVSQGIVSDFYVECVFD